jgi:Family of unknown function (DUF6167)
MRRIFWVALGATAGVLVVRTINRTAQAYTPEGVARSLGSVADALRDAAAAVREGMAEREQELRLALGVDTGEMDAEQAQDLLDHPSAPRRMP